MRCRRLRSAGAGTSITRMPPARPRLVDDAREVRHPLQPRVSDAGRGAERREVHVLGRHEQPVALGEVSLIERPEDRAAAVVRHDDHQIRGEPLPVPEQRARVVQQRQVADQRDRRAGAGGRDAERGGDETVDTARAAVRQHLEPVARRHRDIEVPDRRRVPDEQRAPSGTAAARSRARRSSVGSSVASSTSSIARLACASASCQDASHPSGAGSIRRRHQTGREPVGVGRQSPARLLLRVGLGMEEVDHEESLG